MGMVPLWLKNFYRPRWVLWKERTSGTESILYTITYGSNLWVRVAHGGMILTSPEAIGARTSLPGFLLLLRSSCTREGSWNTIP